MSDQQQMPPPPVHYQQAAAVPPRRFRLPVVWLAVDLAAILAGYVTAYTTVLVASGLGDAPNRAAALCASLNMHTPGCSDFSTASNIGVFLIAAGVVGLVVTGIRTAVRYQRYRDQ